MKTLWALPVALALYGPLARADVTTGQAAEAANKGADAGPNWSSALDKSTAEASGQTVAKEPADTRLLKEHLAEEERAARQANAKAAAAAAAAKLKGATAAEVAKAAANKDGKKPEEDDLFSGVANTVKEVVRPLKETAEELKKAKDEAVAAIPIPVIEPPKPPDPVAPNASGEGAKRQYLVSAMMWEEFVAEIKPWAIGTGVVLLIGGGLAQWLSTVRRNSARSGARRPSKKRGQRAA